jgi:anthranilate phosphoribosyltransferase
MRCPEKRPRMDNQFSIAVPFTNPVAVAHVTAPVAAAPIGATVAEAMLEQREVALVVGGEKTPELDAEEEATLEYLHNMTCDSLSSDTGVICSEVSFHILCYV